VCVNTRVCVCVCVCVRKLTLWCCMMAVAFRFADIFSSSGCPLLPPLAEREIFASPVFIRLFASILLPSLCPSLPSVRFSLLTSHRRPPEGTATITRDTKAGEARGLMTIDKCTLVPTVVVSSSIFFPRFRLTVSSGARRDPTIVYIQGTRCSLERPARRE